MDTFSDKTPKPSKGHVGAISELTACAWLLEQGYQVFRNVAPDGPVDIIALNPSTGETTLIDVKTVRPFILKLEDGSEVERLNGVKLNSRQAALGVKRLAVIPGDRVQFA